MTGIIERLKPALSPLPALLEEHGIKLRRNGTRLVGLCPFHKEKTPSFHVSDRFGEWRYHCFGCGAHGDALDFLATIRGVSVKEAVGQLAREHGIESSKPESRRAIARRCRQNAGRAEALPESEYHWVQRDGQLLQQIAEAVRTIRHGDLPSALTTWGIEHIDDASSEADARFEEIFQLDMTVRRKAEATLEDLTKQLSDLRSKRYGGRYTSMALCDEYLKLARRDPKLRERVRRELKECHDITTRVVALLVVAEERRSIYGTAQQPTASADLVNKTHSETPSIPAGQLAFMTTQLPATYPE